MQIHGIKLINSIRRISSLKPIPIYVCELKGSDLLGTGTEAKPFQSLKMATNQVRDDISNYDIFIRKSSISDLYEIASKSSLKKALKQKCKPKHNGHSGEQIEKSVVLIQEDESLPSPVKIKLYQAALNRGNRVKVQGWVHRLRKQKGLIFIVLRDGHGYLQCVLSGNQCKTIDAINLTIESTIVVYGTINVLPEGKYVFNFLT